MSSLLRDAVELKREKILNGEKRSLFDAINADHPLLVVLAAGKGTRFGEAPKCAQRVCGIPLARHSINSFQSLWPTPAICVVGYHHGEVTAALGDDNIYVLSDNPVGGTAFATYEAFSLPELERRDPVLFVGMGDRIIPAAIFKKLFDTHLSGGRQADLTLLTAVYEPPRNRGKGRVIRDSAGKVLGILEQRDIDALHVDRDRESWKWSAGSYGSDPQQGTQTTGEMRKVTGKSAELAAILLQMPLDTDFFKEVESEFVSSGVLGVARRRWVCELLKQLPLLATRAELRRRLHESRGWYVGQLRAVEGLDTAGAEEKADATFASLFAGWRDPVLRRTTHEGRIVEEHGVPLRAIVAYLFGEVAKNFWLIHHRDQWIDSVARSQRGDRCFDIDPGRLPGHEEMMSEMDWERGCSGPRLMERWLEYFGARPFNYNMGLDDESLSSGNPPELHLLEGSNFFRGLALIDLAEAMLQRAFGLDTVAVRVNAAGQGDFFQVHIDTERACVDHVKQFVRAAFYRRFGLSPEQEFVELHPGGGAVGVRLERFDQLPLLISALREAAS